MLDIAALPKVLLHDHLDGGLRPETIISLAQQCGHSLPTTDPHALGLWFQEAADSGSLVRYLETFTHTVAVMQTRDALMRVAREAVEDLAADGVIYAELRWAPEQHLLSGLALDEAVIAVRDGIAQGVAAAAGQNRMIAVNQLITAMRHADRWREIAELAVAHGDDGVVGFDIAGAEAGFPADRFPDVWQYLADESFPVTIHAGEADGVASIATAVRRGHALRIGHGVRILDDIAFRDDGASFGRIAAWVRDRQLVLELCPSSNLQTGAASSIAEHGISKLRDLGFAVTINTDNRLMSATSVSREMELLVNEAGWGERDLLNATLTAARSAFISFDERSELVEKILSFSDHRPADTRRYLP
ncbi:adenosine deaminase [Micrococcales bacterium KH10]|nr:adenosine deaminase [Micrococcales bacterium KH10]